MFNEVKENKNKNSNFKNKKKNENQKKTRCFVLFDLHKRPLVND